MESDLAQEAIAAALTSDWKKAIAINSKIIKLDPSNVDALNRIARAYAENDDLIRAQKYTSKVLKIDPTNTIAKRCEQKWKNFKRDNNINLVTNLTGAFIEDPRKTRLISLINLGDDSNIMSLDCGDPLKLTARSHRVNVTNHENKYIGRFPDDLAAKFIQLIKLGGTFEVLVKSVNENDVKIFVRDISKNGF